MATPASSSILMAVPPVPGSCARCRGSVGPPAARAQAGNGRRAGRPGRFGVSLASMFGIDWGTTSLRAYRLDAAGRVLEKRDRHDRILIVLAGGFPALMQRIAGDWPA